MQKIILTIFLLALLILPVSADDDWVIPTIHPIDPGVLENATYDFKHGEYTQFWANWTDGFPIYGFVYSIFLPLMQFFGFWIYAILWFTYLGITWLRTSNTTLPLVVGLITAPGFGMLMPEEAQVVAIFIFSICVVGIVIKLFTKEDPW